MSDVEHKNAVGSELHLPFMINAGSPNGSLTGPLNQICFDTTNKVLFINTNGVMAWTQLALPVPGVKIYRALLTQEGSGTGTMTNGTLEVGHRYLQNSELYGDDDFSNVANVVAGTVNTINCEFIATGTTPTKWTNSTELLDLSSSAPVATILENSLGEVPELIRVSVGACKIIGTFPEHKTFAVFQIGTLAFNQEIFGTITIETNEIALTIFGDSWDGSQVDGWGGIIEILVYP